MTVDFRHKAPRSRASSGFTVIELLVVMTIIAVLVAITLPVVSRVRNLAMSVKCQGNIKSLTGAMLLFAVDHNNCLPDAQPWGPDWLMSDFTTAPVSGTLYPYVNSQQIYLCPAMDVDLRATAISNGKFDYGFFTIFEGASIRTIPLKSQMNLLTGGTGWYPTPIICQEDGYQINGYDIEGDHSNVDQMAHLHDGGSWYGSIDGSVTYVIEPDVYEGWSNGCWQWNTMGPSSHQMHCLGSATWPAYDGFPAGSSSYGPPGTWYCQ